MWLYYLFFILGCCALFIWWELRSAPLVDEDERIIKAGVHPSIAETLAWFLVLFAAFALLAVYGRGW